MTDFDYDVMQKKRIARGAAHMKRGSKSKKCSLPSDGMTAAEWKRRNGPVSTYKLDAPMAWDDFCAMPRDLKIQYIENLRQLYGATNEMLSELFHVHFTTSGRMLRELGISVGKGGHTRLSWIDRDIRDKKWRAFCNGVVGGEPATKSVPEPVADEAPKEEPVHFDCNESADEAMEMIQTPIIAFAEEKTLELDELSAMFTGKFDPAKFLHWVTKLPMPSGDVKIRVEVNRV